MEHKGQPDPNETPEDVATLYSWANLHGAKYRDFSASRAQTREKARERVEQAIEEERLRARQQAEPQRIAEAALAQEEARKADIEAQRAGLDAARQAAYNAQQELARRAALQAAQTSAWQPPRPDRDTPQSFEPLPQPPARVVGSSVPEGPAIPPHQPAESPTRPTAQQAAQPSAWLPPRPDRDTPPPFEPFPELPARDLRSSIPDGPAIPPHQPAESPTHRAAQQPAQPSAWLPPRPDRDTPQRLDPLSESPARDVRSSVPDGPAIPPHQPAESPAPHFAMREENYTSPRQPWTNQGPDNKESAPRPAWLTPDRSEPAQAHTAPPPPADDTLQGSRDRLATRWYALQGIFEGGVQPMQSAPAPSAARAPMMAVFSLAGGVGKTSLVATLGRALSARGERVLLVDTAAYGLMPFFFGARDQRPGLLRTFSPPLASGDAPIQMITLDPETLGPETAAQEPLTLEISTHSRGVGRVIIDLATASGATTRRVLRLSPQVLVPLVPDMSSVVSVSSIDAFFQRNNGTGKPTLPHYVLNQFDPLLPLHLDVREVLREQLGDRLLPFVLRYTPAVSEALAEGMTVMDYAPNSAVADDFVTLAGWVKSLSAPAITGFRGVRWSER